MGATRTCWAARCDVDGQAWRFQIAMDDGDLTRDDTSVFDVAQIGVAPALDFRLNRGRMRMLTVVSVESLHIAVKHFYEEGIMENQNPKDGSARETGREGAGSSMGKDISKDMSKDLSKDLSKDAGAKRGDASSGNGSVIDKAKDMAREATKDLPSSPADLNKSIDKVAEAAHPAVDRLAVSAHAGVDKVSGALAGATRSMDERTRQLTDAARTLADSGREYVRTSPATSVLAALGAGYLLAKILGSRR